MWVRVYVFVWKCISYTLYSHQSMRFAILIIELASHIMLIESTDKTVLSFSEMEKMCVCVNSMTFAIVCKCIVSWHQRRQSPNPKIVQCNWIIYICYFKWAAFTKIQSNLLHSNFHIQRDWRNTGEISLKHLTSKWISKC